MSDRQLRDLERKKDASPQDRASWLQARVRAGTLDEEAVQILALTGDAGAAIAAPPKPLNFVSIFFAMFDYEEKKGKDAASVMGAQAMCRLAVERKSLAILRLATTLVQAIESDTINTTVVSQVVTSQLQAALSEIPTSKRRTRAQRKALVQKIVDGLTHHGCEGLAEWILSGSPKVDYRALLVTAAEAFGAEGASTIAALEPERALVEFEDFQVPAALDPSFPGLGMPDPLPLQPMSDYEPLPRPVRRRRRSQAAK